jgi:HEAT repeat protein
MRSEDDVIEVAAQEADPAIAVPRLLQALNHPREGVRMAASSALYAYGEPAFQGLLWALEHGTDRQRKETAGCLGNWQDDRAVKPLLRAIQKAEKDRFKPTAWGCLLIYLAGGLGVLAWLLALCKIISLRDTTLLRTLAVRSLGQLSDVRAIGLLARVAATKEQNHILIAHARTALLQLLPIVPSMTLKQADLLGPEAIPSLAALLAPEPHDLTHCILQALYTVGDGRAVPSVAALAQNRACSVALREEAQVLLPILQTRADQEDARILLLRGAYAPPTSALSQVLLRPAHDQNAPSAAPDTLLRAALSPPEDAGYTRRAE